MINYSSLSFKFGSVIISAKVDKVFCLGGGDFKEFCEGQGLCIGVSLKHIDAEDSENLYKVILESETYKQDGKVFGILKGDLNGRTINIPLLVHDSNSYIEKLGTSCVFGYLTEGVVCPDEAPSTGQFGHVVSLPDLKT